MSRPILFLVVAAFAAAVGVAAGAFGAHGLQSRVTPERLETFRTGVQYHMYHALGLLAVAWVATQWPSWQVHAAGYLFMAGIVLFSGSLYILVLTDTPVLGAVTPFGGVAFVAGWILLAWGLIPRLYG